MPVVLHRRAARGLSVRRCRVLRAESGFDGASYSDAAQFGGFPGNPQTYVSPPGAGLLTGVFAYDAMGRIVSQTDYANGSTMVHSRAVQYDAAGRVSTDDSTTRRGSDLLRALSTSYYATGESGAYAVVTTNWRNGSTSGAPATLTTNTYLYWDPGSGSGAGGAVQSTVRYDSDTGSGSNPIFTSSYKYDAFGRLTSAAVNDGRPRTVTWTNDAGGQVIRRDDAGHHAPLQRLRRGGPARPRPRARRSITPTTPWASSCASRTPWWSERRTGDRDRTQSLAARSDRMSGTIKFLM